MQLRMAWLGRRISVGEHAALAVGAGDQALADDAFQRAGELGDDLRLLVGGEDIDDAVDGLRRVRRVQGGEHEVAGFRSGESDADGVEIAEFGNHDDVRILAQRLAQGAGEAAGVGADLPLLDQAGAVFVNELDGVLQRDDHAVAGFRDAADHGGERGGFTRAGDAGDEHESAAQIAELIDNRVMPEGFQIRDVLGDEAEGRLGLATGHVDVSAEAADAFDLERVVELPLLLQRGALGFGKRVEDQVPDGDGVEDFLVEGDEWSRSPVRRPVPRR